MMARNDTDSDYVVIGAGSAGCALAARLSEDPRNRVTLLDAGVEQPTRFREIPGVTKLLMANPRFDWLFRAEPDPSIDGRQLFWHAGRMAGGGSSINGMVYIRGRRGDYDDWAEMGATGWGWSDVEPWFRRIEGYTGPGNGALGQMGPLSVSPMKRPHPLAKDVIAAGEALGFPHLADHNAAGDGEGVYYAVGSQANGMRVSSARAYLIPALGRPNLRFISGARVDRILFDGKRVSGVRYVKDGQSHDIGVGREAIVSAGTMQSPLVLLRSGIGPAAQLRDHGIDVLADREQVGGNLQEHIGFAIAKHVDVPTYNSEMNLRHGFKHVIDYVLRRAGPLAAPSVQVMGWLKSDPALEQPDLHMSWLPFAMDLTKMPPVMHAKPAVGLGAVVARPHARGRISLRDASVDSAPKIDFQMMGDERDVKALIGAVRLCERIYATEPLASHVIDDAPPFRANMTDAEIVGALKAVCRTGLHTVGSCRMGSDVDAVVDTQLRVRGVEGLRVADASIMPRQISANTNATAIMIGERAASLILDRQNL
ncbi:GMC family oxidoreductase [Sphingomonas montanisoli]|uniref:Glucose-methanol-choline oxidoreductase n=1 Tax=Sphingomonas montanisoli TaxID=2606412 RepID=A0A5D9CDX3_9SPHN|nr:GMC family oxidoreductase N-terminal domain-containing protein [Sphingomonas montanisoli]TZG29413.1 glucose-methanol-choline oxidoreductase [Sphingomonas montanisoli]